MEKVFKYVLLTACLGLLQVLAFGQMDSLILTNGDNLAGEIKSMDKGVLLIETAYSDKDFSVKWMEIGQVYTSTRFLVTLQDGRRINTTLRSTANGEIILQLEDGSTTNIKKEALVNLIGLESAFWSRVNAGVDLGFSFTKANHIQQGTAQINAGYLGDTWSTELFFNVFRSVQDSIEPTRRNEGGINYKFYLQHDWYLSADVNYLSNTEQALKARYTGKLGAGKFLIHSNHSYWGIGGGLSLNKETFTNETSDRSSAEAYGGTEINLFDTGDLSLLSTFYVYPSLTESGRFRSDCKVDTKYEFVNDFYVKFNITLNYDNRPAIVGNETDYVYGISFGWEL
jgi:hypothetical protein